MEPVGQRGVHVATFRHDRLAERLLNHHVRMIHEALILRQVVTRMDANEELRGRTESVGIDRSNERIDDVRVIAEEDRRDGRQCDQLSVRIGPYPLEEGVPCTQSLLVRVDVKLRHTSNHNLLIAISMKLCGFALHELVPDGQSQDSSKWSRLGCEMVPA